VAAFTDEELKAALEAGESLRGMATRFACDRDVVKRRLRLLGVGEDPASPVPESVIRPMTQRPRLSQVIDLDPAPFAVPIAKALPPIRRQPLKAVVFGDTQLPYHDPKCLAVVEGIIAAEQPDILLHMGDMVDCFQISDYDRDPNRLTSLQDDIDASRTYLHRWAQLAPQARRVLLEGNHEDRLRRVIWNLPGTASELARLRSFQQAMTWPNLLGLDEIGWEYIPGGAQSRTPVLPKLISIHGHQLGGSTVVEGGTARKAIQKFGRSVIVGHHHRACVIARRDHNGQAFGIESGATCLLDGQPYGQDWNWQQAVTVIEWSEDRTVMTVNQVLVRDGRALWRGQDYEAAA
jgi:hypothetical protein